VSEGTVNVYADHATFRLPPNRDGKIWQYMDLAQFVSMLHRMQLFFIKANKLRDPYEGTMPQFNNLIRSEIYATEKHKFQSEDQFNHFISTMPDTMQNQFQAYRELVLINSWHYNMSQLQCGICTHKKMQA
jgi:hypothetical protein